MFKAQNKITSINFYQNKSIQYAQVKTPQVTYFYTICTNKNTSSNFYLYNILKKLLSIQQLEA